MSKHKAPMPAEKAEVSLIRSSAAEYPEDRAGSCLLPIGSHWGKTQDLPPFLSAFLFAICQGLSDEV